MKKTLIAEFFTTISFRQAINSLAFMTIKLPFLRKGFFTKKYENEKIFKGIFLEYLNIPNSLLSLFYNGRTAIYQCLKTLKIGKGDEIIINAYNCVSVINSIIQTGATPIYIDIDEKNLSFDLDDLENKITKNTKLIILQHTFGKTGPIEKTIQVAKKHNILVLEDVAHSLGSSYKGKKHGTFGDFAIFSTGRDKVISSINGGILLTNNLKYFSEELELKDTPRFLVWKNHFYNLFGYKAYKTYDFFSLGKVIMYLSRRLKLMPEIVSLQEKNCKNQYLEYSMPNSLVKLATKEFGYINQYYEHRKKIANIYDERLEFKYFKKAFEQTEDEELNYFRYPIVFETEETARKFYDYMRKNNVLLGNSWSGKNIVPKGTNIESTKYKGDCLKAEKIASCILLLPNSKNIKEKDALKIIELSNSFKL